MDVAGLSLAEYQIQHRHRDQPAADQLPEHITGSHRRELIYVAYQQDTGSRLYPAEKFISQMHIYHGYFIQIQESGFQVFYCVFIIGKVTQKPQCHVHR